MSEVTVSKSAYLNNIDEVKTKQGLIRYSLDDKNDTNQDLIVLYMYQLTEFPQHGIKVGMTKCKMGETFWRAIKSRISVQEKEIALTGEQYSKYGLEREVCYWGVCLDFNKDDFKDYKVHKRIQFEEAGIVEKEQEWFINVPKEELIDLFKKVRDNEKTVFVPRKEQRECIDKTKAYFESEKGDRFLLNCKMRFGKSYTTYKYCEEAGIDKILILTFVPAVEDSWREDLNHIEKEYRYYTDENLKRGEFNLLTTSSESFVLFLSLQNYLGKTKDKTVKARLKQVSDVDWDLVILDEYHFGAWNSRTQETFEDLEGDYAEELNNGKANDADSILRKFNIHTKKTLCLSGTPFKVLARGEFTDESSYTYSYFDEQRNKYPKSEEDNFEVVNPEYEHFPDMKIFGYNMANLFSNLTDKIFSEDKILGKSYFSLNKFFETEKDYNSSLPCTFVYESAIKEWLGVISGKKVQPNYISPYSAKEISNKIKHSLWLMPTQNACEAMADLLLEDDYFSKYQIINLSQQSVGAGKRALRYLNTNIQEAENKGKLGSIAITVNKLTIGVTVKKWSSVFVLKDLSSPEQYFQAIFRVQTPYKEEDKILKRESLVFDFNIDRASALLLNYAEESASEYQVTKLEIAKLIVRYIPIFINGDIANKISEDVFFQLAEFGDSSGIPFSKRIANIQKVTGIENDETIAEMMNDPEVSAILKKVFAHAKFSKPKTRTYFPKPDNKGFNTPEAIQGGRKGYELGLKDMRKYGNYDSEEVQKVVDDTIERYIREYMPTGYNEQQRIWFSNGFKRDYLKGLNFQIKKLQCGKADGLKFVDKIKEEFGEDIEYCKETSNKINDFMNRYLKEKENIPEKYRGMIYMNCYVNSFKQAVRNTLAKIDPDLKSKEDIGNILKHILVRLFEFLYISVYRETNFNEIFKNADPNRFLEATGITKKDFEQLNKYHIFKETILNNYISDFFSNEALDTKQGENADDKYRNSFNWFGFGDSLK